MGIEKGPKVQTPEEIAKAKAEKAKRAKELRDLRRKERQKNPEQVKTEMAALMQEKANLEIELKESRARQKEVTDELKRRTLDTEIRKQVDKINKLKEKQAKLVGASGLAARAGVTRMGTVNMAEPQPIEKTQDDSLDEQGKNMKSFLEREYGVDMEKEVAPAASDLNEKDEKDKIQGERMEAFIKNNETPAETGKDGDEKDLLAGEGWSNRMGRRNIGSRGERGLPGSEKEKDEKLAMLKMAVDNARKDFAKKDYTANNTWQKLRRFLRIKDAQPDNLKESWEHTAYKSALNDLLTFRLDDLKSKNLPPDQLKKEMGDLAKYFNLDEKINLYEARTNARKEDMEGSRIEKITSVTSKAINWYRKLNWKYKIAFSGVLFAGGLVAGTAGAAGLIAAIGTVGAANRVLSGAAAGVGTTGLLESLHRKKERKVAAKKGEEMLQNFDVNQLESDVEQSQNKFDSVLHKLQGEIDTYHDSLKSEQKSARKRRIAGVGVAAFIGSGAAASLTKWGFRGITGMFGHHGVPSDVPGIAPKPGAPISDGSQVGPGDFEKLESVLANKSPYGDHYYNEFNKGGGLGDAEKLFPGKPSTSTSPFEKGRMGGWDEPYNSDTSHTAPAAPGTMPLTEDEAYAKIMEESKRRAQEAMSKAAPGIPNDDSYMNPGAAHIDNIQHGQNVPQSGSQVGPGDFEKLESDIANQNKPGTKYPGLGETYTENSLKTDMHKDFSNVPRVFASIEIAGKGNNSVWKMIDHQLGGRYGASYTNLGPEQKANIISTFTNQVGKNPGAFGLKNIDTLKVGQKVDFSKLFENGQKVHGVFDHAEHLKPGQLENIRENNKSILRWLKAHPGERLTTPKVAEILEHRNGGSKVAGVGGAVEQTTVRTREMGRSIAGTHGLLPENRGAGGVTGEQVAEKLRGMGRPGAHEVIHGQRPAPDRMPFYEPQGKGVSFNPNRDVVGFVEKYFKMKGVESSYAHKRALELAGEIPKLETAPNGAKTWVFEKGGARVEMTPDGKHIKKILAITDVKGGKPVMPSETSVKGQQVSESVGQKADNVIDKVSEFGAAGKKTVKDMLFDKSNPEARVNRAIASGVLGTMAVGRLSEALKKRKGRKGMEALDVNFSNRVGNELRAYQEAKERKDKKAEDSALQVVFKKMRETMIGRSRKIKSIEDLQSTNAQEFLSAKANSREPLVQHAKFFEVAYGSVTRPLKDETLDVWTKRMVKTIIRSSEKQEDLLEKAA
jgi:hypothetical protein